MLGRGDSGGVACQLVRELYGCWFCEPSFRLGWALWWHSCHWSLRFLWAASYPSSSKYSSPMLSYATTINSVIYSIRLEWDHFFGLMPVPYLGWTNICSHLPTKSQKIASSFHNKEPYNMQSEPLLFLLISLFSIF